MIKDILNGYKNKTVADLKLASSKDLKELDIKAKTRLEICKSCDILNKISMTCDKSKGGCGCNMKVKIYCKDCKCPKGKW